MFAIGPGETYLGGFLVAPHTRETWLLDHVSHLQNPASKHTINFPFDRCWFLMWLLFFGMLCRLQGMRDGCMLVAFLQQPMNRFVFSPFRFLNLGVFSTECTSNINLEHDSVRRNCRNTFYMPDWNWLWQIIYYSSASYNSSYFIYVVWWLLWYLLLLQFHNILIDPVSTSSDNFIFMILLQSVATFFSQVMSAIGGNTAGPGL